MKGTAWWLTQAAIEMADYDLPKVNQDPTEAVLFGTSAEFKQQAWETAFNLIDLRVA